jgi:hypothetical protein
MLPINFVLKKGWSNFNLYPFCYVSEIWSTKLKFIKKIAKVSFEGTSGQKIDLCSAIFSWGIGGHPYNTKCLPNISQFF